jgi:hypothetical protein
MRRNSSTVSTKQQRIAELAKQSPQMGFTSLAYLMDVDWLREAFYRTRKNGAPGVDGQTWSEYAKNLEDNLQSLLDRPSVAFGSGQVRHVSGAAGASGAYSERGLDYRDSPDRYADGGSIMHLLQSGLGMWTWFSFGWWQFERNRVPIVVVGSVWRRQV